jgi:hypothetical protein
MLPGPDIPNAHRPERSRFVAFMVRRQGWTMALFSLECRFGAMAKQIG